MNATSRHPLERFLSSFRDKIELGDSAYFHSLFGEYGASLEKKSELYVMQGSTDVEGNEISW